MVSDRHCRISFVIVMWEAYVSVPSAGLVALETALSPANRGWSMVGTTRTDFERDGAYQAPSLAHKDQESITLRSEVVPVPRGRGKDESEISKE